LKSERSGLINPETFKMFDFRLLAAGDAGFHTKPSVLEELGHKRLRQYYLRYKADSQAWPERDDTKAVLNLSASEKRPVVVRMRKLECSSGRIMSARNWGNLREGFACAV
jgi:hypothetical protein